MSTEETATQEAVNHEAEEALLLDIGDLIEAEDPAMGAIYPVVQWVNGDPQQKRAGGIAYTGGFFISAEQGLQPPGFEPYTLVTREAVEVAGFASQNITGTPIRYRRSWLAKADEKSLARRYPWNGYEAAKKFDGKKSPRGRGQILWLFEGSDEPVVLTFSGMAAARIFSQGRERGALPTFDQNVVKQATRIARKEGKKVTYPMSVFKLTIGPGVNSDGTPVFHKLGSGEQTSTVSQPVWINKVNAVDQAILQNVFLIRSRAQIERSQAIWKESVEWADAWNSNMLLKALKRAVENNRDLDALTDDEHENEDGSAPGDKEVPF